jgi:hypothetical protein
MIFVLCRREGRVYIDVYFSWGFMLWNRMIDDAPRELCLVTRGFHFADRRLPCIRSASLSPTVQRGRYMHRRADVWVLLTYRIAGCDRAEQDVLGTIMLTRARAVPQL